MTIPSAEINSTLSTTEEQYWFTTTNPNIFDESLDFIQEFGAIFIFLVFIGISIVCLVLSLMKKKESEYPVC